MALPTQPTTIRDLSVPDTLVVAGTAQFTGGSLVTPLVHSNPGDDLQMIGHAETIGTSGAIKLSADKIEMYADSGLAVVTVNNDRLSSAYVETDKSGRQTDHILYADNLVSCVVGGAAVATFDTTGVDFPLIVSAGEIWGKTASLDISADGGALGANHAGLRLGPTDVDIYDGTTDSPDPQASFAGTEAYMTQTVYAQMNSEAVSNYGTAVWNWGVPPQTNFHWAVTPGITVNATNVTIVRDGVYEITAGAHVGAITGRIQILLNGATVIAQSEATSIVNEYVQVTGTLGLVPGDYVEVVSEVTAANEKNSFFKINKKMGTYDYIQDGASQGRL